MSGSHVLVGVDGGKAAELALEWAAAEAARGMGVLRIVNVVDPTAYVVYALAPSSVGVMGLAEEQGERVLEEARASVRALAPDVRVDTLQLRGPRVPLLEAQAREAALLVLGAHEAPFAHGGLGSLTLHATAHADCPVVVVRGTGAEPGAGARVVVGVDGSELSLDAVRFAMDQADRTGSDLEVVYAITTPRELWVYEDFRTDILEEGRRWVSESLAGERERCPGVRIHERILASHPVPALLEAATGARLLVVGSHGRGRFAGMLLGSVGHAVLRQADCPVAVVRRRSRRSDTRPE